MTDDNVTLDRILEVLGLASDDEVNDNGDYGVVGLVVDLTYLLTGDLRKAIYLRCPDQEEWATQVWVLYGLRIVAIPPPYCTARDLAKLALRIWKHRDSLLAGFSVDWEKPTAVWRASDTVTHDEMEQARAYWYEYRDEDGYPRESGYQAAIESLPAPQVNDLFEDVPTEHLPEIRADLPGISGDDADAVERIERWLCAKYPHTDTDRYVGIGDAAATLAGMLDYAEEEEA